MSSKKSVFTLIQMLKALEANPEVVASEYLTDTPDTEIKNKEVEAVVSEADICLMAHGGKPCWGSHKILEIAGYPVTCGERDSFGWLTGVIHTEKGKIVYG